MNMSSFATSPSKSPRSVAKSSVSLSPSSVSPSISSSPITETTLHNLYQHIDSNKQSVNLHHANGSKSQVLFVPVCNTKNTFERNGKNSLVTFINSMSNQTRCFETHNEPLAV